MRKIITAVMITVLSIISVLLTGCGDKDRDRSLQLAPGEAAAVAAQEAAARPGGEVLPYYQTNVEDNVAEAEAAGEDAYTDTAEDQSRKYTSEDYEKAGINELNSIPILMYHRIYDLTDDETGYTGGNTDEDGYGRTWESLENDLISFYEMGYRCMRLTDYIDGNISVPYGYSPLILTFDDGVSEAAIDGFDEDGNPVFKPHSALGILEKIKKEYPDYDLTATFFLNEQIFDDIDSYEDKVRVVQWMADNGYDIGNHTLDHVMLDECTAEEIEYQVGGMYKMLEEIIPGRYVNIVALPYGVPDNVYGDARYEKILSGSYDGFSYTTRAVLLNSWTRQYSPFVTEWDPTHIRRIKAYDNNGEDFDIEYNFAQLNDGRRYISDGDPDTVVIRADEEEDWLADTGGREVIRY